MHEGAERLWAVHFRLGSPPTLSSIASLELIASLHRQAQARGVIYSITCAAPPPTLNGVGRSLYFVLSGRRGSPVDLAQALDEARLSRISAYDP